MSIATFFRNRYLIYYAVALQMGCVQRRAAVCAALGLGNCDGKQLLRQLNQYNFSRESVGDALQTVLSMPTGSLAYDV